jgi:hypothetical protein
MKMFLLIHSPKKNIYKYDIMDTINYKVIFCGHVEISRQFQF